MEHQAYQLSISSLSVGTWLQTLVFYLILVLILQVIFAQLNLSPIKMWSTLKPENIDGGLEE
jgi:hypothetical protein